MTTQKNGSTIPTNGKKVETTVPVVSIKPEPVKETAALPVKLEVTPLEKSLMKVKELVELQNQHTRLLLSGQKLDEFRLQKGEENIQLELTDENNRKLEFSTQNPEVVIEVINCLRSVIQDKRKSVEARLMTLA